MLVVLSVEEIRVLVWCLDTFEPLPTGEMGETAEKLAERLQELLDEESGTKEPEI